LKIAYSQIIDAATQFLVSKGCGVTEALAAAEVLTEAEARGYPSQGLMRLSEIEQFLSNGFVQPNVVPHLGTASSAIQILKADGALGYLVARNAVDKATELAKLYGIGAVGITGASHIGYLTHYAERGAAAGMFCLVTTVSSPAVGLPGSGKKLFGTNPLAYAFPTSKGIFCADISLAATSRGNVIKKDSENRVFSEPVGFDKSGCATAIPKDILEGAIAPIGSSIRGCLLNLLISVLAGPLIGGVANHHVTGTRFANAKPNKGDFILCIDINACTSPALFGESVEDFLEEIRASCKDFHVPGRHSLGRFADKLRGGISLPQDIIQQLNLNLSSSEHP